MRRKILFVLTLFFIVVIAGSQTLSEEANLTDHEKAKLCLNKSLEILTEMNQSNFSILRINDSLYELESVFQAQEVLLKGNRRHDFSLVLPYCEDISNIREEAFDAIYELEGLKKFAERFLKEGMNISSVDLIFSNIREEIKSERYENVGALIEQGYEEITNIQASNTALNLFYKTTTRTIKDFFIDNWIALSISFCVLFVLSLIYRSAIRKWIIKKKIRKLEDKREVFRKLIQKMQKDYFEKGKVSEGEYEVKTKKFSEMIRDIDREIPLLKADYMKVERVSEKEEKKMRRGERMIVKEKFKKSAVVIKEKKIAKEKERKTGGALDGSRKIAKAKIKKALKKLGAGGKDELDENV